MLVLGNDIKSKYIFIFSITIQGLKSEVGKDDHIRGQVGSRCAVSLLILPIIFINVCKSQNKFKIKVLKIVSFLYIVPS